VFCVLRRKPHASENVPVEAFEIEVLRAFIITRNDKVHSLVSERMRFLRSPAVLASWKR
jgi:hypothetical protein